jgi:3-oxoacyl-[acyl-carrier protein] reductase
MKQESKKTAIITGSGRGIGKETAIILAKKSVNVVVCSRTQSEINTTVEEISKQTSNSSVLGIKCDVSIPSGVQFSCQICNRKIWKRDYRYSCKQCWSCV